MAKYTGLTEELTVILDELSQPAAPYYESRVASVIYDRLKKHAGNDRVQVWTDRYGNIVARYQHPNARFDAALATAAHTDHPGYHMISAENTSATLSIQGGLPRDERLVDSGVLLFRHNEQWTARITRFTDETNQAVVIELDRPFTGDTEDCWGVPDVERFRVDGDLIHGRAMDDLVGCAQQLALLDLLVQEQIPVEYIAVFNRAEEVGFVGAIGACELGSLPRHAIVLSLEASKNLEGARPGKGIILRTGDRQSVFDVSVTNLLEKAGNRATDMGYLYQKRLMDGGTCEAALYMAYGYETGALAVPLINYHNQGETSLESEAIDRRDLTAGVVLLVELARELVENKRIPRSAFKENRLAWFTSNRSMLLKNDHGEQQN